MEEIQNLVELLATYDCREVVSGVVGAALGTAHATYHRMTGVGYKTHGGGHAFLAGFSFQDSNEDPVSRDLTNVAVAALCYEGSYRAVSKIFKRVAPNPTNLGIQVAQG